MRCMCVHFGSEIISSGGAYVRKIERSGNSSGRGRTENTVRKQLDERKKSRIRVELAVQKVEDTDVKKF